MTKRISNFKNSIIAILLIAITLVVSGMILITKGNKLFAYYSENFTGLSNQDFTNTTGSEKPMTPTSWNLTSTLPSNVKAGVISLDTKTFDENNEENYKLSTMPEKTEYITSADPYVLMINGTSGKTNIGYTSNSFTFNSNAYYKVLVHAYSQANSNAYGTIVLNSTGLEGKVNSMQVETYGQWKDYEFFIKTNQVKSLNDISLQLWLGSNTATQDAGATGAVLYDNISITEYTQDKYNLELSQTKQSHIEIDLQNNNLDIIKNANFEKESLENWTVKANNNSNPEDENNINGLALLQSDDENHIKNTLKVDTAPTTGNFYNNKKALLINNTKSAESIGYESDPFTLDYNSVYKLSVWAKSSISEGTAQLVLKENSYKENDTKYDLYNKNLQTFTLDLGTSTNNKTNNWIEYNFYITTKSYQTILEDDFKNNFTLGLWVGTQDSPAKGYAFFDNITICKITTSDIPSSTTDSKVCSLIPDSTTTIKNGQFNNVEIISTTETYPLSPKNWTLTSSNNDSYHILNGVINTNSNSFNEFKTTIQTKTNNLKLNNNANAVINPKKDNKNTSENVLMLGNLNDNYQYYESESFTLTADKYYELSVDVFTSGINNVAGGLQLIYDNGIVGEKQNISTQNSWENYKMYIKTGSEDSSVSLKLSLGQENNTCSGFAFFDNVTINEIEETDFTTPSTTSTYKKVNLASEDFTNIADIADEKSGYFTPYNFTFSTNLTNIDDVKKGVITNINANPDKDLPESASSNNILAIESLNSDAYHLYKTNKNYSIDSSSYYEISVWIKTESINHNANEENAEYGASFFLSNSSDSFKGFKGINTNGEWKKYSIYINSTDATNYNINLALGNENDSVRGNVYFSTLTYTKLENSEDYYEAIKPLEEDDTVDNILAIGNTDKPAEDNTDSDNNTSSNEFKFDFTLVASIITAVAILIALIGFGVRKINFKKPVKVGKKDYDREVLNKKIKEQEQKITNNDAKLNDLKSQLDQTETDLTNLKNDYQAKLQEIEDNYKKELANIVDDSNKQQAEFEVSQKYNKAKQDAEKEYNDSKKDLMSKYDITEKEIEMLYQQEMALMRDYKSFKKEAKNKKK